MKKIVYSLAFSLALVTQYEQATMNLLSMNKKHDPLPVYTAVDDDFLLVWSTERLRGNPVEYQCNEILSVSISPYGQTAANGRNMANSLTGITCNSEVAGCTQLGDLGGNWDMITLLFGPLPQGKALPPALATARANLFPTIPVGTPITDPRFIDPTQQVGFFSIPLRMRNKGVRAQLVARFFEHCGLILQGGVTDICQVPITFTNLTCASTSQCASGTGTSICGGLTFDSNFSCANINTFLMNELNRIAREIGLDIGGFHKVSVEDLQLHLFWRRMYELNRDCPIWPHTLITPFITVGGQIATSNHRDLKYAFGLPFGNDDHHAVGFTAGLSINFLETVEIGGWAGITHFFEREVCNMRIPNSRLQSGIYPFTTDAIVRPGQNWHFGLKMCAYHFIDRLSFSFLYQIVQHKDDEICLKKADPAFVPEALERITTWKSQMANTAFTYDISPNVTLGFVWQAPLSQRNAYRSTTVMLTFNVVF